MKKIVTLCFSAGIQKTIEFSKIQLDKVNRSKNYRFDIAGKAVNSARVLTQLAKIYEKNLSESEIKEKVTLICPLGEKNLYFWEELSQKEMFSQKNVLIPGFTRECCTLVEDCGRVTELVVEEPNINNEKKNEKSFEILNLLETELSKNQAEKPFALLVAGSVPEFWQENIMSEVAKIAKKNDILLMVDFRGKTLLNLIPEFIPEIIKINEEEFYETFYPQLALDVDKNAENTISNLVRQKSQELSNIIIVTRGEKNTILGEAGKVLVGKTEKIQVKNPIACGDAFNAGFLYEFSVSRNLEKALEMGTFAASRNAENLAPGAIL